MIPATVRIEGLAHGGEGVARPPDGPVVFVPDAAPGDLLEVRSAGQRGGVHRAEIVRILQPGPGRRRPPCPEAPRCGGCGWQHLTEKAQAEAAQGILVDALQRIGRLERASEVVAPARQPAEGSRRRARWHVDVGSRPRRLGFFARRTHEVHAVTACSVLEPELDDVRRSLERVLDAMLEPVTGLVAAEMHADLVQPGRAALLVDLRLSARPERPSLDRVARTARDAHPALGAVAVEAHVGTGRRPRRAGRATAGDQSVSHREGPTGEPERWRLHFEPGGFLQASRDGNRQLLDLVLEMVGPASPRSDVLELFAGHGNLTLALAGAGHRLVAVESDPAAVRCARRALREARLRADVRSERAEAAVEGLVARRRRFDVVVLDPPRTGAFAVARLVPELGPARVVYASCDAATLARDAGALATAGYELRRAVPVLMFPQTPHFETVALFTRALRPEDGDPA